VGCTATQEHHRDQEQDDDSAPDVPPAALPPVASYAQFGHKIMIRRRRGAHVVHGRISDAVEIGPALQI
jgi:hypothetical protein